MLKSLLFVLKLSTFERFERTAKKDITREDERSFQVLSRCFIARSSGPESADYPAPKKSRFGRGFAAKNELHSSMKFILAAKNGF